MSDAATTNFAGLANTPDSAITSTSVCRLGAENSLAGTIELLLKDPARLDLLLRNEGEQRELIPRLLVIALTGYSIYGVILTALLNAVRWQSGYWLPYLPVSHWNDASVANLTLAYTVGLIAAHGICLPSFYFYGLLAGVRTTMLAVTALAVKGMAAAAITLVGLLPIYIALALTSVVLPANIYLHSFWIVAGLLLPFVAGIAGAVNIYNGFVSLADTMRVVSRKSRECFLRRLMLAWVVCASFVIPAVIYTLWDYLSTHTASGW